MQYKIKHSPELEICPDINQAKNGLNVIPQHRYSKNE